MYDDRPAPRDFTPEPDETEETDDVIDNDVIDDDPPYDPAKQTPVSDEKEETVHEMVDVENPEGVAYDLEDERD